MAFADRSWSVDQDVQEISRFSCMLFLSVRGFLDYAGPIRHSRLAWLSCCLPPYQNGVGILIQTGFSKLNSPAHRYLCLRFKRDLAVSPARLEARMESLSPFLQGSFIPYNMPVYPGALRIARYSLAVILRVLRRGQEKVQGDDGNDFATITNPGATAM